MKTMRMVIIFGAMIFNISAFAQVVPGLGVDLSSRKRGMAEGFDALIGGSNGKLFVDASTTMKLVTPTRRLNIYQANLTHYAGNTSISALGFGTTEKYENGYVSASLSPLLNFYVAGEDGIVRHMPLTIDLAFQKKLSDWVDIEGRIDAGIVYTPSTYNDATMLQGTARLQLNSKLGENSSLSPFVIYNGRTGGSRINNVIEQKQIGFKDQGTTIAGVALKVAL